MADVKVRNLPDSVVITLRARAVSAGRSLEEELRAVLIESASKPKRDALVESAEFRRMLQRKYGTLSDSTEGIRADRQSRG